MYKIVFIDKNHKQYDFCEFGLCDGEQFLDKLEEVLYIMQEMTPLHRNWKTDLTINSSCLFTYHGLEYAIVKINRKSSTSTIEVIDI